MAFPNPDTQFKPGNPGGPGRKPGSRSLSSVIVEMMDDDDFELKLKNGEILKGRPSKNLVKVMYSLAISGNTKAADWIAKYGYGVKQIHEFQNNPIEAILDKYGLDKPNTEESPGEAATTEAVNEVKSQPDGETEQTESDSA